jgi:malonate decarboxylase gamma subunit
MNGLLEALFPRGHSVRREADLLFGSGRASTGEVSVVGVAGGAEVGVEAALALARELLRIIKDHPLRPILALIDTRGQRMTRRDEVLGLNGYLAHLASCVELARRRGHRVLALVHGEAVSGPLLGLGFMADEIYATEQACFSVMSLPAMARVTKIPLERLEAVSRTSAVLASGLDNWVRLGAVESVWRAPLADALAAALARQPAPDERAARGAERGGRSLALAVARRVRGDDRG